MEMETEMEMAVVGLPSSLQANSSFTLLLCSFPPLPSGPITWRRRHCNDGASAQRALRIESAKKVLSALRAARRPSGCRCGAASMRAGVHQLTVHGSAAAREAASFAGQARQLQPQQHDADLHDGADRALVLHDLTLASLSYISSPVLAVGQSFQPHSLASSRRPQLRNLNRR
ncbi:hypothetical protein ACCO45_011360 [Purpureocillium lilacinum]|uniref:Uncharacterized protein n=1 Tax=Purpureocillium lilacinum TaxID=33203 RepID=A0ACC4DI31_PURLI